MGLSASQARMLSLTARLSDLELRAQTIENAKIRLSDASAAASTAYSDALDKQTLKVYSGLQSNGTSSYITATAANLTTYGAISTTDKQRFIKNAAGQVLVSNAIKTAYDAHKADPDAAGFLAAMSIPSTDTGATTYYTNLFNEIKEAGGCITDGTSNDANMKNSEWLQSQIDGGNLALYEYDSTAGTAGTGDYVNVAWNSGDATLSENTDTTQTAKAEATYETTMASIQAKDKRFDQQLSTIDTEHTATQTEIESVKKVMNKNIERSFKIFDA